MKQPLSWIALPGLVLFLLTLYTGYVSYGDTSSGYRTGATQAKVVTLVPPRLSAETILGEVTSDKPVDAGASTFHIAAESIDNHKKLIIHCTSAGSASWTNAWGAVEEAITLFKAQNTDKDTPIRIIGAGCVGLATAAKLAHQGYNVVGITTKDLYDTPSWHAAGYFAWIPPNAPAEEQAAIERINVATLKAYREIAQGTCPYLTQDTVQMMPVYCGQDTTCGLEELEASGHIPPAEEVILDFGHVQRPNFLCYTTYFMDVSKVMQQLVQAVEERGIPIECTTVKSFEKCAEPIIFNCTGLDARALEQGNNASVRSHAITLNEKAGTEHMKYIIYTTVQQDGQQECMYMVPQKVAAMPQHAEGASCQSIIGGTSIKGIDLMSNQELEELDKKTFQQMLDRSVEFFYGARR